MYHTQFMLTINMTDLKELFKSKLFSDVKLIISDHEREIEMLCHKCILWASCPYFKIAFSNHFSHGDVFEMRSVPNAHAMYDIISSFYGAKKNIGNYSENQTHVWHLVTKDFLNMDINIDALLEKQYISDDWEIILSIIDQYLYHNLSISFLKKLSKNIPTKISLMCVSDQFRKKINRIRAKCILFFIDNLNRINVHGVNIGKRELIVTEHPQNVTVFITANNNYIGSWDHIDQTLKIIDTARVKFTNVAGYTVKNISSAICAKNKIFFTHFHDDHIYLFSEVSERFVGDSIYNLNDILACSSNGTYLLARTTDLSITIISIDRKLNKFICTAEEYDAITFTLDETMLIIAHKNKFKCITIDPTGMFEQYTVKYSEEDMIVKKIICSDMWYVWNTNNELIVYDPLKKHTVKKIAINNNHTATLFDIYLPVDNQANVLILQYSNEIKIFDTSDEDVMMVYDKTDLPQPLKYFLKCY